MVSSSFYLGSPFEEFLKIFLSDSGKNPEKKREKILDRIRRL